MVVIVVMVAEMEDVGGDSRTDGRGSGNGRMGKDGKEDAWVWW